MADERSNFPGFELQQRLFTHYAAGLKQVSERLNEAWGKVSKGQYGYGDLVADLSRGAAAQSQFFEELVRLSTRDDHRAAWARLTWPRDPAGLAPSATVDLLRPINGILEQSRLICPGGNPAELRLTLTPILDGNRLRIAVADGTPRPAAAGIYFGFVATQEARHTPEVVVVLEVRD